MTNPLHEKLYQAAQELRSGKAFSNPDQLINKLHARYSKMNFWARQSFVMSSFLLSPMCLVHLYLNPLSNWAVTGATMLSLFILPAVMLNFDFHKGGMENTVAEKLSEVLRIEPSLKDSIAIISNHINHPDVTNNWWTSTIEILNKIINENKKSQSGDQIVVLQQMIDQENEQDVLISVELEPEEQRRPTHTHQTGGINQEHI